MGVVVTGVALWLSFRKINWPDFFEVLSRIQWEWVAAALGNVVLSVYIMGWRLKVLLRPKGSFSMGKLFRLNMLSQYWSIVLPARGGDVVKAYLLSREKKIEGGFAAGSVVLERMFDFFVFCVLVLAVPLFVGVEQSWFPGTKTALISFIVLLAFVGFIAFVLWKPGLFLRAVEVFSRIFPQKFRKTLGDFFSSGTKSFQILKSPPIMGGLVLFTFFFVGLQVLSNYFVFLALGLKLSYWAALVVFLTLQVGSIPPSSPGKIGVFEVMVILALAVYGIEKAEALGYAVLLHLVVYVPKIVMGGWFVVSRARKAIKVVNGE